MDAYNNQAISHGSGAMSGYTGSPGDSGDECTACHSGTPINQADLIASDIPVSGYVPGNTYTLTATVSGSNNKFGFLVTSENASGIKSGTFVATNTTNTKAINLSQYITHKSAGTTGSGNSKTWTFDWTAPVSGTGSVTFYAAFNAANGNGSTSGDEIVLSSLVVNEDITSGIASKAHSAAEVRMFPNPIISKMHISFPSQNGTNAVVSIHSLDGKLLFMKEISGNEIVIDEVADLDKGIYLVNIKTDSVNVTKKIIKN